MLIRSANSGSLSFKVTRLRRTYPPANGLRGRELQPKLKSSIPTQRLDLCWQSWMQRWLAVLPRLLRNPSRKSQRSKAKLQVTVLLPPHHPQLPHLLTRGTASLPSATHLLLPTIPTSLTSMTSDQRGSSGQLADPRLSLPLATRPSLRSAHDSETCN